MPKNKNDYFKLVEEQVGLCASASELLETIICGYSPEKITDQRKTMHDIEHVADELQHDILTKLSSEFITPIDQEDILRLVQIIDDVTDALDEVVLEFYMFHVDFCPASAPDTVKTVNRCVKALYAAAKELKNFKKPEKLRELLVEVNNVESEADAEFVNSIHMLFGDGEAEKNGKTLIAHKAIYESLENCCDLCEHAADVIEQIIIKNT